MARSTAQQRQHDQRTLKKRGFTSSPRKFNWLCRNTTGRVGIVSEGDSWFAYPPKLIISGPNSNIIDHIQSRIKNTGTANLLRLASNGDEAAGMMAGKQKHTLAEVLKENTEHVNLILFSGGGNDLVGKWDMERLLKPYRAGATAADCIYAGRFKRKLKRIELAFQELIELRDEYCPSAVILTHTYDKAQPSNRGGVFLWGRIRTKPWIYPYLIEKGIPAELHLEITEILLGSIRTMLQDLAAKPVNANKLKVVDTYGTLRPGHLTDWLNEIHPTPAGFKRITKKVYTEMKALHQSLPAWS